jgi:hypothetical protein
MYKEKEWHWGANGISSNRSLTLEILEMYKEKEWHWGANGISSNPSLTLEILERFEDKDFHWGNRGISYNRALTLEILERFEGKNWVWDQEGISSNPILTLEIFEKFEDKPWEEKVYKVMEEKRFWRMMWEREKYLKSKVRLIEEAWIECRDNPKYEVCFNMALRDINDDYTFEEWKKDRLK